MKLSHVLLGGAAVLLALAFGSGEEEILVMSIAAGGASAVAYIAELKVRLARLKGSQLFENRVAELERRLNDAEIELDATSNEVERLKAERDFDRKLLAGGAVTGSGIPPH